MSVRAMRSENDVIVLQLRSGGDIHCDQSLIVRVEPDEVEYPDEVAEELSPSAGEPDAPTIPEPFRELVTATAARHGVDARVVSALIEVESAHHNRAGSPNGG